MLQSFCHFNYVTAHSPIFLSFHLRHSSFSNPSVALPTSQLLLQPFRCFTYVTAHSQTLIQLLLRHRLFTYVTWRVVHGQLQSFCHFTYVTAHSPIFLSFHLRHSSFFNHSVALPTSQLLLQPFRCFTYVTAYSPTLISLLLRHRLFTYVAWRTAHGQPYVLKKRDSPEFQLQKKMSCLNFYFLPSVLNF